MAKKQTGRNSKSRRVKPHQESEDKSQSVATRKGKASNLDKAKTKYGLLVSAAVVGIAAFWGGQWFSGELNADVSPLGRLMYYWPPGGPVAVKLLIQDEEDHTNKNTNRGLVATQKIPKGSIAIVADHVDLKGTLLQQQPQLESEVERLLQTAVQELKASMATMTTSKILAIIRFLQLVDIEKDPRWTAYADTLPTNVTSVAFYWTKEEWECVVTNRTSEVISQNIIVFHTVMGTLAKQSSLLQQIYSDPARAEWALLMINVRGFGDPLYFIPILDMADHNPLQALHTVFRQGKIYSVATQDIESGQVVYNTYGDLSPFETAIIYGFVQSEQESAFFEVPSIRLDMWRSERTKTIPQCTEQSYRFFGNVNNQTGQAHAFLPVEKAYQCIRKLVQSPNDTLLALYVADKLQADHQRYDTLANAEHCQSNEGNFPLIRTASRVTAKLLWEAYEIANRAAKDETIAYPGISSYKEMT